jgi:hypothetical protein
LEIVSSRDAILVFGITVTMLAAQWQMRNDGLATFWQKLPGWGRSVVLAALLISLIMAPGNDRAFIYFQF